MIKCEISDNLIEHCLWRRKLQSVLAGDLQIVIESSIIILHPRPSNRELFCLNRHGGTLLSFPYRLCRELPHVSALALDCEGNGVEHARLPLSVASGNNNGVSLRRDVERDHSLEIFSGEFNYTHENYKKKNRIIRCVWK